MKSIFLMMNFIACLLLLSGACSTGPQLDLAQVAHYEETSRIPNSDSLLVGIEDKIYQTFVRCIIDQDATALQSLSERLESTYAERPQNLVRYWSAYLQYYWAIYHLKSEDEKAANRHLQRGIDWLDELPRKNAEDYALLAMMQGFAIRFSTAKTIQLSRAAKKNVGYALAIDSTNLRAHYVMASNDYYTPAIYGGGKIVERHLQRAVALPDQKVENAFLPSWGKELAYELLVRWYIKGERWAEAKATFQQAQGLFPDSYPLNQLAGQLIGR
ncbi:MAG: hypothetical protein AAFW73_04905 [Bacteroidota bacterium]